jgi:hypothetical protein
MEGEKERLERVRGEVTRPTERMNEWNERWYLID